MSTKKLENISTPHIAIAKRIRKAIKNCGLTESDFAKKIKIHKSSLSKYLAGHHAFSYEMLQRVLKYTDCDASWLLTGKLAQPGEPKTKKQQKPKNTMTESQKNQLIETQGKLIKSLEARIKDLERNS
ncbi:MAG: helix-turn-helix transcriptional regulator [Nitrospinae bacterium]|nr:helix-turn-helix transcriptional regulator [Nitrospinota bacterium]